MKSKFLLLSLLGLFALVTLQGQTNSLEKQRAIHYLYKKNHQTSILRGGACVASPYSFTDSVYQVVIAIDPYCCDTEWDNICQNEYDSITSGTLTCVSAPYTFGDPIYEQVIANDNFCCNTEWDGVCQTQYNDLAGIVVPGQNCEVAITAVEGINTADGPWVGAGCYMCTGGANANWFVYTADSSGTISINSCGQGVNTNVWVYKGTCFSLNLVASNDDFCETEPGGEMTASYVEFGACAGETYYIEWDDSWSSEGFNFVIAYSNSGFTDLELTSTPLTPYTHMPLGSGKIEASCNYANIGSTDINQVESEVKIMKGITTYLTDTDLLNNVFLGCQQSTFNISNQVTETGNFVATVSVSGNQTEENELNNSASQSFTVDTTFARDNNQAFTFVQFGQEAEIATLYKLESANTLTSLSAFVGSDLTPGTHLRLRVYDNNQGLPGNIVATSIPYELNTSDGNTWVTVPLADGPLDLPAGEFFVSSMEEGNDINIPIGVSDNIYTPFTGFINVPGQTPGFDPIENYEPIQYSIMLRANFGIDFTSIHEAQKPSSFQLVPNPSTGIFYVKSNTEEIERISVIDASGKLVKDQSHVSSQNYMVDVSDFANGIYTVRVISGNKVENIKLIIAK